MLCIFGFSARQACWSSSGAALISWKLLRRVTGGPTRQPSPQAVPWLIAIGGLAWLGQIGLSRGYGLGRFSTMAAMDFARLPAALAIGIAYGLPNPAASIVLARHAPADRRGLFFSIKQTGVPIGVALAGLLMPPGLVTLGWRGSTTRWVRRSWCNAKVIAGVGGSGGREGPDDAMFAADWVQPFDLPKQQDRYSTRIGIR